MIQHKTFRRPIHLGLVLLFALPALACLSLSGGDPSATETAIAAQALTQAAPTPQTVTDTPVPPPTDTPEPTVDAAATQAVADAAATEAGLAPIRAALGAYGVGPDEGQLGWVHNPVLLEVTTFKDVQYASDYPTVIVRDFVVQSDVTWETKTGLAGCGFFFRANSQTQDFYGMGMFRGGNGVTVFNEWRGGVSAKWDRYRDAPSANAQDGSTNTMAVVGRGSKFTFYVNGVQVDSVTNPDLAEGSIGFAAFSESGTTRCNFEKSWMWVLD